MRSLRQSLSPGRFRDIVLVGAATLLVGASFGAITIGAGLPWYLPSLLSVVVFAGAAQFMFVGIIAAGGSPLAATVAGLVVNLRHVPFGLTIGDVFGTRWRGKIFGSYLMSDETVAFTLAESAPAARRAAYWICGSVLFVSWNLGVVIGSFGGAFLDDPAILGLDAAFPAVLLALILPSLAGRRDGAAVRGGRGGRRRRFGAVPAGRASGVARAGRAAGGCPANAGRPSPMRPGR